MSTRLQTSVQGQKSPSPKTSQTGLLRRTCACGQHTTAGGECEACRKKPEASLLQRSATASTPVGDVLPIVHEVLRMPGQPLDQTTRAFMEPRFGHDFSRIRTHSFAANSVQGSLVISQPGDSLEQEANQIAAQVMHLPESDDQARNGFGDVRVHTDAKAAESAQAIGAAAYTSGSHIVFATGRFSPESHDGRQLLAHELVHVVQQTSASSPTPMHRRSDIPTRGSFVARKEAYPRLHEEVLKSLIAITKQHSKDGEERLPALLDLAKSISDKEQPLLHARLAKGRDAFADYLRIQFPITREAFLKAIEPGSPGTKSSGKQVGSPSIIPPLEPTRPPSKKGSVFVSSRYSDVQSNPMYIDNFVNDINQAWLPNDRIFVFEYPNGVLLKIALQDVVRALQIESDLNPQPSEDELREKYKIPSDLVLPKSTSPSPLLTAGNRNVFFRDEQTEVIYPTGSPIQQTFLPRITHVVKEIESVRVNQELLQRNLLPLLNVVTTLDWSAPRGIGALLVGVARRGGGRVRQLATAATKLRPKIPGSTRVPIVVKNTPKLHPVNGRVNVGGGLEEGAENATNLNSIVEGAGGPVRGIPNHVKAGFEDIDQIFEPGSVKVIVSRKLPSSFVNWEKSATGAAKVMPPGGKVAMNVWQHGNTDSAIIKAAFEKAGFKNVKVIGEGAETLIFATR